MDVGNGVRSVCCARLRVISGKHRGKNIPIVGSKFLIGREQDCQLRPNSEMISRHHCVISIDPFTVRLRDLASTNGTYVNEQRVNGQLTLKAGDVVRVGKLRFEVLISQVSEEELSRQPATGAATALASLIGGRSTSDTSELSDTETAHEIPIPLITGNGDSSTHAAGSGDSGAFELGATPPAGINIVSDSGMNSLLNEAETTVVPHHALVPVDPSVAAQQQYAGMGYTQPMHYMPGAPYQPMPPQYMQPPMQYPYGYGYSQPGMYAPPTYPMAPPPALPQQPAAPVPEVPVDKGGMHNVSVPDIVLPDPSQTGVKQPPPPKPEPVEASADGQAAPVKMNPSQEAANIIRQHMQRRPGA